MSLHATPAKSRRDQRDADSRWVRRWSWLGSAALLLSGCFKATFISDPSAHSTQRSESFWQHEFIYGLIGSAELDLRDVCASGQAQIETGGDLLTTAMSLVSAGLYTPRTVVVRCQSPASNSAASAP